ncbi:hypothetical protein Nepgr_000402 [Nepenthes gracilis]|uniref:Uncharacterized protein n=1 Tax=Nepenthes gracilis TaxID=150966 RepID=A0AAD3RWT2_NEPGR|nr:hypothetical protein Nepgr_000402 [Nepenthes gracilis]
MHIIYVINTIKILPDKQPCIILSTILVAIVIITTVVATVIVIVVVSVAIAVVDGAREGRIKLTVVGVAQLFSCGGIVLCTRGGDGCDGGGGGFSGISGGVMVSVRLEVLKAIPMFSDCRGCWLWGRRLRGEVGNRRRKQRHSADDDIWRRQSNFWRVLCRCQLGLHMGDDEGMEGSECATSPEVNSVERRLSTV